MWIDTSESLWGFEPRVIADRLFNVASSHNVSITLTRMPTTGYRYALRAVVCHLTADNPRALSCADRPSWKKGGGETRTRRRGGGMSECHSVPKYTVALGAGPSLGSAPAWGEWNPSGC